MKSSIDAARLVLAEAKQPLHYKEITRRVLAKGLWQPDGDTPEATMSSQLSRNIKAKGDACGFRRIGAGIYGLVDGTSSGGVKNEAECKQTLSFTDAAEHVLDKFARRQPMHYRDITAKALEIGVLYTSGQTPEATMYAQIIQEEQRRGRRAEPQRFERHGKGMVGLTGWMPKGLENEAEKKNRKVREELYQSVVDLTPQEFEELVGRLLSNMGFEDIEVTALRGDGGVDVRGTLVVGEAIRTRMAVQAKKWKNNIQAPAVQQMRGSLGAHEQGLIITTSDFSKGAYEEAMRPDATPVGLMNGEKLIALLVEYEIGVKKKSLELLTLSEEGLGLDA